MKVFELFVGTIIIWITHFLNGKKLYTPQNNISKIKVSIMILLFSILLTFFNLMNFEIMRGIIKFIVSYSMICFFYKIIYKKDISQIVIGSFIAYLCIILSEIIVAILISIVFSLNNIGSMVMLKNTIIIHLLICSCTYLAMYVLPKKIVNFTQNIKVANISSIIIIFIILITLALLCFKIPLSDWNLNLEFLITMILLISFCVVGFVIIKQKSDIQKTTSMYQQLVDYSDITNNLLEDYRVVSHEHKNQLSIIRGMVNNDNKELIDYLDNLLEKRDIIKYQWIGELNHLPLSGLKGLINYKLIEMESINLNTSISISKNISKTKLNNISTKQKDNLYSIMGVYLDNAIQASKKSKKKEISLEIYREKKDIVIVLANTYSGKIEFDKIDNYGYPTKGKKHGVGLHIVKKIIEEDKLFNQNRSLFQDYFVQELRINLSRIKTKI